MTQFFSGLEIVMEALAKRPELLPWLAELLAGASGHAGDPERSGTSRIWTFRS